jgi:hypothetical protein
MIAEPIDWRTVSSNMSGIYFAKGGEALFYIDIVPPHFGNGPALWQIGRRSRGLSFSMMRHYDMSRGEFFDRMSAEYPDHLEWLMWHPEWF